MSLGVTTCGYLITLSGNPIIAVCAQVVIVILSCLIIIWRSCCQKNKQMDWEIQSWYMRTIAQLSAWMSGIFFLASYSLICDQPTKQFEAEILNKIAQGLISGSIMMMHSPSLIKQLPYKCYSYYFPNKTRYQSVQLSHLSKVEGGEDA